MRTEQDVHACCAIFKWIEAKHTEWASAAFEEWG